MPDTFIEVITEVENNLQGTVIGAQIGHVEGDLNLTEIKFYSLDDGADSDSIWNRILVQADKPPPYKFLEPYTATDKKIFFGRDSEITDVLSTILGQRLLVIYGQAGVGKTSLVEAGVIPRLIEKRARVLQISSYTEPVLAIREAFKATSRYTDFRLGNGKESPEPKRVKGAEPQATRTLFLVLDQFELLFEPAISDAQRVGFVKDLTGLLQTFPPESLKVIILARDDAEVKGRMAELQGPMPDLLNCHLTLLPLSKEAAEDAINRPLDALDDKVSFPNDGGQLIKVLAKDLDKLTEKVPGIYPPHLQIVCHELRSAALRKARPYLINMDLYQSKKGAEGILASYMENRLDAQLKDVKEQALQVLSQMASPGVEHWVAPHELELKDVPAAEMKAKVEYTLGRLVKEKLLVRQWIKGSPLYGFVDRETAQRARRLAGDEVALRYQAEEELERVWAAWLARDVLASRDQLRYLTAFGTHLKLPPLRVLFLLRSAVERDEPSHLWLDRLRGDEGSALIRQLEVGTVQKGSEAVGPTDLKQAEFLLTDSPKAEPSVEPAGEGDEPPEQPAVDDREARPEHPGADGPTEGPAKKVPVFKSVSKNAVTYPKASARQASALALTALSNEEAIKLLDKALLQELRGWRLMRRRAELRGALLDAVSDNKILSAGLSWRDRPLVWLWRASHRVARNRERMGKLMLYGAVGAALAVGLLRALITLPGKYDSYSSPGVQFNAAFYFTAACVLALLFGMTLADSLLTPRAGGGAPRPANTPPAHRSPWRAGATIVGVGALMFGVANVIVIMFSQFSFDVPRPMIVPGFVIGLGFGAALYTQLRGDGRVSKWVWPLSLGIGASVLVLTQLYFNLVRVFPLSPSDPSASSFLLGWNGAVYRDLFGWESWPREWLDALAVVDAAAFGATVTAGATLGLDAAKRSLAQSLSSPHRLDV